MAATMKFICIAILCCLIVGGDSQCTEKSLSISQSPTGKMVQNKPEWKLTLTNKCTCTQSSIKLDCSGFQSVKKIDPSLLNIVGSVCFVNDGNPIFGNTKFSFTYASANKFPFKLLFSQVSCS